MARPLSPPTLRPALLPVATLRGSAALARPALVVALVLATAASAHAATPASGTLSSGTPELQWTGGPLTPTLSSTCGGPANPQCDNFALTLVAPPGNYRVEVSLTFTAADDYDLEVYDGGGTLLDSSGHNPGEPEAVTLSLPPSGSYTVSASPFAPTGPYTGVARLVPVPPPGSDVVGAMTYGAPLAGERNATFMPRYGFGPSTGDAGIGLSSGEPTLGSPHAINLAQQASDPFRTHVMFLDNVHTLRVTFDDCTDPAVAEWRERSVPFHATSLDPILQVDPATGRTWSSQLAGKTSLLGISDDLGETWAPSQGSGINSGVDHQTIGVGPFPAGDPGGSYPNAVYYASQDIATAQIALSRDGGTTFGPAVPMYGVAQCTGIHGHIQVSPDGAVAVPNKSCGGEQGVVVSENAGLTFTVRTVPGSTSHRSDPAAAFGADDTLYLGFCNGTGEAKATVSTDHGATWAAPVDVGAPFGIRNCAFPEMVAGDGDRAAFAFLGSTTTGDGTAADETWPGVWYLYLAVTYDRGATWSTTLLTPGDPVQRGAVCLEGTTCASGRNLLDFNDIAIDEKGRVLVGYADGCVGNCRNGGGNSGTDIGRITRQVAGSKGLFAAFDDVLAPTAPTAPWSPYVEARRFADRVELAWSRPFDGNLAIDQFHIFRREASAPSFSPLASVPVLTTTYTDDTVAPGTDYYYRVVASNAVGSSPACFSALAAAPVVVDPCGGVQVVSDAAGDHTGGGQLDLRGLTISEPFVDAGGGVATPMLVFDLQVADASITTPDNAWLILWNRKDPVGALPNDYDRYMVNMRITATGPECHVGKVTAPSVNRGDDLLTLPAASCTLRPDGHLTIVVPPSAIDDCQDAGSACSVGPGYDLSGLEVRVFASNLSGQPITQLSTQDFGVGLSYEMVGNQACAPVNHAPVAVGDVIGGVTDDGVKITVLANDHDDDGDELSVSAVTDGEHGTVSIEPDGKLLYTPAPDFRCTDQFTYTLSDGRGGEDTGVVTVVRGLPRSDDFESGDTSGWCGGTVP